MDQAKRRVWLIEQLKYENNRFGTLSVPSDEQSQKDMLRALMNIRLPAPVSEEFLEIQDDYLSEEAELRGIVDADELEPCQSDPRLVIWQGDITRLRIGAIVNAANSAMLGCFQPLHNCIDNCIHSFAGIQMRLKCNELMMAQGHEEPTGQCKITPGYNLPCDAVLHTVGPIVHGEVTDEDRRLLASCYRSCLEAAEQKGCMSVAFCCISTGLFMFPAEEAARIAVATVKGYLDEQAERYAGEDPSSYRGVERVVFNVFSDKDRHIYERILG